jgi:Phage integrase family/ABC transporter substrate binding protein
MRRREFITLLGGAAAAWPLAARAQQRERMRRIGILMNLGADDPQAQARVAAFLQGLQEAGWAVDRNVQIDIRWGDRDAERNRKNVAELVAFTPDAILATTFPIVMALQQATREVPIVFAGIIDPVGAGLVASLARPGGHTTGLASSRWGHRDATMILIGYRHGLRASELCDLQWSQVELATGRLHVRRAKSGSPSVHPMPGDEIRALRRLQREQGPSSHVFMTERGGPMTPKAFHALFGRIGTRAKMPFPIHPHMLRHGCGYALANAGHDTRALQAYLGHKNIQHTVRYTELAPHRFKDFWR